VRVQGHPSTLCAAGRASSCWRCFGACANEHGCNWRCGHAERTLHQPVWIRTDYLYQSCSRPQQSVLQPQPGIAGNGSIQIPGVPGSSVRGQSDHAHRPDVIPSILLCVTPFARLLIVFHFLRRHSAFKLLLRIKPSSGSRSFSRLPHAARRQRDL